MIDEVFQYKVKANSFPAHCRVRINGNTVVATELPDNTGMSIINAAEEVAIQVCQFYEIPIAQLLWIEHYPKRADIEFSAKKIAEPLNPIDQSSLSTDHSKMVPLFFQASPPIDETFERVDFEIVHNFFTNPTWKPMSRTMVEELISCSL